MPKKKVEIDVRLEEDKTWDVEVYFLDKNEWVLDEDLSDAHFQTKEAAYRYIEDVKKDPKIEVGKISETK